MNLERLGQIISKDPECRELLNKKIITDILNGITITGSLSGELRLWSSAGTIEQLNYWVNDCIGRSLNKENYTEEQIAEYLKLKWLQVILASKLVQNLDNFNVNFKESKNKLSKVLNGRTIPDEGIFIINSVDFNTKVLEESSFALYTIKGAVDWAKQIEITLSIFIPFQTIALTDLLHNAAHTFYDLFNFKTVNSLIINAHCEKNSAGASHKLAFNKHTDFNNANLKQIINNFIADLTILEMI